MPNPTPPTLPLTGRCACGEVAYRVTAAPLTVYACHCTDCQRQSGSAFGMSMWVPREGLEIDEARLAFHEATADSGRLSRRFFCPACGARIYHQRTATPGRVVLKPGTLDRTDWLRAVGHIWTASAQPWSHIPEDAWTHPAQPEDLSPLITLWQEKSPFPAA